MSQLVSIELGEFCSVDNGFAFKSEQFSDDNNDVFLVKGSNLGHRYIKWEGGPWWNVDDFEKLSRYQLISDDVLLAMDRPIVGGQLKYSWINKDDPKALLVQRVARLRAVAHEDQKFLRYVIASPAFLQYVDTITTGVNVPHISGPDIRKYKFNLPKKTARLKIAAVMEVYDDLIENNLKRIKLLEEMAQITYEEWFVRMKFPGHENAVFDEETGLPDGWKERSMENSCDVSGGGTPSREKGEYWLDADITWFSPTDLSKAGTYCLLDSSQKITAEGLKKSSAKLLQPNSFMMTSRATIGLFALIDKPFSTNQGFINITPFEERQKFYLFFNLKTRVSELYNHASGATFPEISKSKFKKLKINWPSEEMFKKFDSYAAPIISTMMALTKQNSLLKDARDILLPRLMTGIIDIERVELPEAMLKRLEQHEDEVAIAPQARN